MRAGDILAHFHAVCWWLDRERTVDRIIIGDPEAPVRRALVTWMSTFPAVRAAAARGCQLVVTHEPTFWVHQEELAAVARWPAHSPRAQTAARKRTFIEEHGMVVLRIHDSWDRMPEVGIPWAWGRFLGLGDRPSLIGSAGFQHRYDIEPTSLDALAGRIAARTARLGEPMVQVVGDGERLVSKVGIGTGCYCRPSEFVEMGCDVSVVCDDGTWYWEQLQAAADSDHPLIRVNHGTSEEPGMVTLTHYLRETFPDLTVEHLPHGSCFRLVGPAAEAAGRPEVGRE